MSIKISRPSIRTPVWLSRIAQDERSAPETRETRARGKGLERYHW